MGSGQGTLVLLNGAHLTIKPAAWMADNMWPAFTTASGLMIASVLRHTRTVIGHDPHIKDVLVSSTQQLA